MSRSRILNYLIAWRGPGTTAILIALSAWLACQNLEAGIYRACRQDGSVYFTNLPPAAGQLRQLVVGDDARVKDGPGGGAISEAALPPRAREYLPGIRAACDENGVDPRLVLSVIAVESSFNPRAVSPKGAQGLMQLMPATARRFGVADSLDPQQNLDGGVQYLGHLLDLFEGDLALALAAYNAGEHRVQRVGGVPDIAETRRYVERVTRLYQGSDLELPAPSLWARGRLQALRTPGGTLRLTNLR